MVRAYSEVEFTDRRWLVDCYADNNIFRNSFCDIWKFTADFDLALWYLSYGQTFGGKTDTMHKKMAELCTGSDKEVITFKKDIPEECPYYSSKTNTIEEIFNIDFGKSNKGIIDEIYNIYRSEKIGKFYDKDKWCNLKKFDSCEYKERCPIDKWINIINEFKLRFRTESRIFFYYDTLCLLNNDKFSGFNEFFSAVNDLTDDKIKKTIILRSILEQIRGISSKALMFLQLENQSNNRNLDDSELIFVDKRAIRVAERVDFPFYENDLVEAIRKFGGKYNLTANQIDMALYHMGDVCSASGCLHGNEYKCIFFDVCGWAGKQG
ncbi:MAG: hypothetical protein GWP10_05715 [Nitrospiraceae bacterium]|nr:hypothetical protein [Nitrospiraceae bacterium]